MKAALQDFRAVVVAVAEVVVEAHAVVRRSNKVLLEITSG